MLIQIDSDVVFYITMFFTILVVPVLYYCYRIVSQVVSFYVSKYTRDHCVSIFQQNETFVRDILNTSFGLVDRIENHINQYCSINFFSKLFNDIYGLLAILITTRNSSETETKPEVSTCEDPCPLVIDDSVFSRTNSTTRYEPKCDTNYIPRHGPTSFGKCPLCPIDAPACPLYSDNYCNTNGRCPIDAPSCRSYSDNYCNTNRRCPADLSFVDNNCGYVCGNTGCNNLCDIRSFVMDQTNSYCTSKMNNDSHMCCPFRKCADNYESCDDSEILCSTWERVDSSTNEQVDRGFCDNKTAGSTKCLSSECQVDDTPVKTRKSSTRSLPKKAKLHRRDRKFSRSKPCTMRDDRCNSSSNVKSCTSTNNMCQTPLDTTTAPSTPSTTSGFMATISDTMKNPVCTELFKSFIMPMIMQNSTNSIKTINASDLTDQNSPDYWKKTINNLVNNMNSPPTEQETNLDRTNILSNILKSIPKDTIDSITTERNQERMDDYMRIFSDAFKSSMSAQSTQSTQSTQSSSNKYVDGVSPESDGIRVYRCTVPVECNSSLSTNESDCIVSTNCADSDIMDSKTIMTLVESLSSPNKCQTMMEAAKIFDDPTDMAFDCTNLTCADALNEINRLAQELNITAQSWDEYCKIIFTTPLTVDFSKIPNQRISDLLRLICCVVANSSECRCESSDSDSDGTKIYCSPFVTSSTRTGNEPNTCLNDDTKLSNVIVVSDDDILSELHDIMKC